jgi:CDP-diacylglycerol--serine O-phosphatidyltransferase
MGKFRFRGKRRRERGDKSGVLPVKAMFPNLITSIAACAGITSVALASEGRFLHALLALFVACICDGIDGRVARMLNASSKLGAELDSLADFVNFGVAPAMFMFFWLTGKTFGSLEPTIADPRIVRLILGASLFYALCDCFRLARFNTMLEQETAPYWKHFFTGVPAPGGCWMVLTPAILSYALDAKGTYPMLQNILRHPAFGMFMLLFVGVLMASRLPTISLKAVKIQRKYAPYVFAFLFLLIALLFSNFWLTLGVIGAIYILTVPVTGVIFLKVKSAYESRNQKS